MKYKLKSFFAVTVVLLAVFLALVAWRRGRGRALLAERYRMAEQACRTLADLSAKQANENIKEIKINNLCYYHDLENENYYHKMANYYKKRSHIYNKYSWRPWLPMPSLPLPPPKPHETSPFFDKNYKNNYNDNHMLEDLLAQPP